MQRLAFTRNRPCFDKCRSSPDRREVLLVCHFEQRVHRGDHRRDEIIEEMPATRRQEKRSLRDCGDDAHFRNYGRAPHSVKRWLGHTQGGSKNRTIPGLIRAANQNGPSAIDTDTSMTPQWPMLICVFGPYRPFCTSAYLPCRQPLGDRQSSKLCPLPGPAIVGGRIWQPSSSRG